MRIRVLGAFGGEGLGHRPSSFLINDTILLDGGTPQFFAALTVVVLLSVVPTLLCFWPPRRVRES